MDVWILEKLKQSFNFFILLDRGCSYTIVMGRLDERLYSEKYTQKQWHMQARNITNNIKVKVDFTLTAIRAMNAVTWICHMDYSAEGRNDMILG